MHPGPQAVREDLHEGVGNDVVDELPDAALHPQYPGMYRMGLGVPSRYTAE